MHLAHSDDEVRGWLEANHRSALELEHTDRVAGAQQLERLRVVERKVVRRNTLDLGDHITGADAEARGLLARGRRQEEDASARIQKPA